MTRTRIASAKAAGLNPPALVTTLMPRSATRWKVGTDLVQEVLEVAARRVLFVARGQRREGDFGKVVAHQDVHWIAGHDLIDRRITVPIRTGCFGIVEPLSIFNLVAGSVRRYSAAVNQDAQATTVPRYRLRSTDDACPPVTPGDRPRRPSAKPQRHVIAVVAKLFEAFMHADGTFHYI